MITIIFYVATITKTRKHFTLSYCINGLNFLYCNLNNFIFHVKNLEIMDRGIFLFMQEITYYVTAITCYVSCGN